MDLSYSPVPIDTVATARDFQERVAQLAGAVFVIAAVLGATSAARLMSMALVEAMDAALTTSMCPLYAMLGWSGSTSLSVAIRWCWR